MENAVTVIG